MSTVPNGTIVKVELEIPVPVRAVQDDVSEWIKFNIGKNCGIDCNNPLLNYDVEPTTLTIDWQAAATPTPPRLDPHTVEVCAQVADDRNGKWTKYWVGGLTRGEAIAKAIRALLTAPSGVDAQPSVTLTLAMTDYDALQDALAGTSEPNERLRTLLRAQAPWERTESTPDLTAPEQSGEASDGALYAAHSKAQLSDEQNAEIDALLAAPLPQPQAGDGVRRAAGSLLDKVHEVLARRFPRCRDCADEDGTCPRSGLPCDLTAEFALIKTMLTSSPTPPKMGEEELAQAMAAEDRVAFMCVLPIWNELSDGRKEHFRRHARAVLSLINGER